MKQALFQFDFELRLPDGLVEQRNHYIEQTHVLYSSPEDIY